MVFDGSMKSERILFDQVDARLFRAFLFAAQEGSFTLGAIKAGMTQSGMSQHIAKLEEQLNFRVFERVNKKILLTEAGKKLLRFIESYNENLDLFVEQVTAEKAQVRGVVKYAMPGSCLKAPHFPMLLDACKKEHPNINLRVILSANDEIFKNLLDGVIDFGFVTKKVANPAVKFEPFAEEEYVLISSNKKDFVNLKAETAGKLNYIDYPGFGALFEIWKTHFFPRKETLSEFTVPIVGYINSFDGAVTMVEHGAGVTVVPRHCVSELLAKGKVFEYNSKEKPHPVGTIYIITRTNYLRPRRVQTVVDCFWKMKQS